MFLSIGVISANEINDNDLSSIDSTDYIGIDSVDNTNDISSDLNENQNEENTGSDILSDGQSNEDGYSSSAEEAVTNEDSGSQVSISEDTTETLSDNTKEKTIISVSETSVLRGTTLYIYLKDSNGNPLSNKTLSLEIGGNKYTKVTNKNGAVTLTFNIFLGKYTLDAKFKGDSDYLSSSKSFTINIYQIKTNITVKCTSVARGKYLYVYLKDSNGNPIANQSVKILFVSNTYNKTTNANGLVSLKMNSAAGKYYTKITFAGTTAYKSSSKTFYTTVYKEKTVITVLSTSVVKGRYLYAYLKDINGNSIANQNVKIVFAGSKTFNKISDAKGRVSLKINSNPGNYSVKISYAGSGYYNASSKSFTLKSYLLQSSIIITNYSVVRGKCLYGILRDPSKKGISGQKIIITFGSKNYTRITDSNGKFGLLITCMPKDVSVKMKYAGNTSYTSTSRSITVHVLTNATAKIIVKNSSPGEFTIRLTDMNGNPLAGQTVSITSIFGNQSAGTGVKMTKKTIIINSDNIYSKTKDLQFINDIAKILRSKGYRVLVNDNIGPDEHCKDIKDYGYENVCVFCIFGGCDSGMFYDMSSNWYQNLLKKYNNRVVLGFTKTQVNLATCTWLKRAHDDNYSPNSFTGLANPGSYLNDHNMDYVYGRNATEMANNFLKYAVNGLSIGLNNTIPCNITTHKVTTDENGYATISGLAFGTYTMKCSYSNTALGYIADTVQKKVNIL